MPNKILLVDDEPYIEDLVRQKFRKQIFTCGDDADLDGQRPHR